jgi:hypothetical protein
MTEKLMQELIAIPEFKHMLVVILEDMLRALNESEVEGVEGATPQDFADTRRQLVEAIKARQ